MTSSTTSMRRLLAAALAAAATAQRCDPSVDSSCAAVQLFLADEDGCGAANVTAGEPIAEFGLLVNNFTPDSTEEAQCTPSGLGQVNVSATFCPPSLGGDVACASEALLSTTADITGRCLDIEGATPLVAVVDFDCQEVGYCSPLTDAEDGCVHFDFFAQDQCQAGGELQEQLVPVGLLADGECRRSSTSPDAFNRIACDGDDFVISLGCNATCGDCETESLLAEPQECVPLAPGSFRPRDTCPNLPTLAPTLLQTSAPTTDSASAAAPLPARALLPGTLATVLLASAALSTRS